jgi:hypothetical protein
MNKVRVAIVLDEDLVNHFEAQAVVRGTTFEGELVAHLSRTREHTSEAPLYIDDNQRRELAALIGAKPSSTPAKLVEMIRRLTSWSVGGMKVKLTPNQEEAIFWMAKSAGKDVKEIAPQVIEEAIAARLQTR